MGRLENDIETLKAHAAYRTLRLPHGRDFSSNDYLGLAQHPKLVAATIAAVQDNGMVGAGGSRLLRGHHPAHEKLEEHAARFFGSEAALFFGGGFLANFALFTTLPERHDAVIFDEHIHASVKEGIHAGTAKRFRAAHNDLNSFEDNIKRARESGARDVWIAVESVYSMDGDVAPLSQLYALARAHNATLIVDEAHATGVFGASGRGLSEGLLSENVISVHTCGKALGVYGALVCSGKTTRDYLINKARPFIYATAPPPHLASGVSCALDLVEAEPWRRTRLAELSAFAAHELKDIAGGRLREGGTQILPFILGEGGEAVRIAALLQAEGFDVRAIRPPTVPEGTARLRISLNININENDIAALAQALATALEKTA